MKVHIILSAVSTGILTLGEQESIKNAYKDIYSLTHDLDYEVSKSYLDNVVGHCVVSMEQIGNYIDYGYDNGRLWKVLKEHPEFRIQVNILGRQVNIKVIDTDGRVIDHPNYKMDISSWQVVF